MKVATRLNDKYSYGGKIVTPITEDEYNRLAEVRIENTHNTIHGFIVFNSDFLVDEEYQELFDDLEERLKSAKKEFTLAKKAKEQILKMGSKQIEDDN